MARSSSVITMIFFVSFCFLNSFSELYSALSFLVNIYITRVKLELLSLDFLCRWICAWSDLVRLLLCCFASPLTCWPRLSVPTVCIFGKRAFICLIWNGASHPALHFPLLLLSLSGIGALLRRPASVHVFLFVFSYSFRLWFCFVVLIRLRYLLCLYSDFDLVFFSSIWFVHGPLSCSGGAEAMS